MPIDFLKGREIKSFLKSNQSEVDRRILCEKLSKQDLVDGIIMIWKEKNDEITELEIELNSSGCYED